MGQKGQPGCNFFVGGPGGRSGQHKEKAKEQAMENLSSSGSSDGDENGDTKGPNETQKTFNRDFYSSGQSGKKPFQQLTNSINNVVNLECFLNHRKNNPLYSFSKNIDYEKITEKQKRLFLREKKQRPFQKIVPVMYNKYKCKEDKENQSQGSASKIRQIEEKKPDLRAQPQDAKNKGGLISSQQLVKNINNHYDMPSSAPHSNSHKFENYGQQNEGPTVQTYINRDSFSNEASAHYNQGGKQMKICNFPDQVSNSMHVTNRSSYGIQGQPAQVVVLEQGPTIIQTPSFKNQVDNHSSQKQLNQKSNCQNDKKFNINSDIFNKQIKKLTFPNTTKSQKLTKFEFGGPKEKSSIRPQANKNVQYNLDNHRLILGSYGQNAKPKTTTKTAISRNNYLHPIPSAGSTPTAGSNTTGGKYRTLQSQLSNRSHLTTKSKSKPRELSTSRKTAPVAPGQHRRPHVHQINLYEMVDKKKEKSSLSAQREKTSLVMSQTQRSKKVGLNVQGSKPKTGVKVKAQKPVKTKLQQKVLPVSARGKQSKAKPDKRVGPENLKLNRDPSLMGRSVSPKSALRYQNFDNSCERDADDQNNLAFGGGNPNHKQSKNTRDDLEYAGDEFDDLSQIDRISKVSYGKVGQKPLLQIQLGCNEDNKLNQHSNTNSMKTFTSDPLNFKMNNVVSKFMNESGKTTPDQIKQFQMIEQGVEKDIFIKHSDEQQFQISQIYSCGALDSKNRKKLESDGPYCRSNNYNGLFQDLVSDLSSQEDQATQSVSSEGCEIINGRPSQNLARESKARESNQIKKTDEIDHQKLAIWRQSLIVDSDLNDSEIPKELLETPKIRKNFEQTNSSESLQGELVHGDSNLNDLFKELNSAQKTLQTHLELQKQKSFPYGGMQDQDREFGTSTVSVIQDKKDQLVDSRQESIERCVKMLDSGQKEKVNQGSTYEDYYSQRMHHNENQGPIRQSKLTRYSKLSVHDIQQKQMQNSSRFTSQSLTFPEDENLDEFSCNQENTNAYSPGILNSGKLHVPPSDQSMKTPSNIFNGSKPQNNNIYAKGSFYGEEKTKNEEPMAEYDVPFEQTQNSSSNDEVTQFNQQDYLQSGDTTTVKMKNNSKNTTKEQIEMGKCIQNDYELCSPAFGKDTGLNTLVNSQQCRKNESTIGSHLADSEGVNYKSPCSCPDCTSNRYQQNLGVNPTSSDFTIGQNPFDQSCPKQEETEDIQINFECIYQQQQILKEVRDILEIRPSVIQNYSQFRSQNQGDQVQAIEAMSSDNRVRMQQLCQEWWDLTQEDGAIFNMALVYQQQVQENYFKQQMANKQDQMSENETDQQERDFQNFQRSQCMRQCMVLSSVVVGLTAFFSMLVRPNSDKAAIHLPSDNYRQDLELRSRLSQLFKIVYDQFILCLNNIIGKYAGYDQAVLNRKSYQNKLYNSYMEHIHLLFINKKIQSEDDYQIFNTKSMFRGPISQFIGNEENRDYQINQLSQRLRDNSIKLLDVEIQQQMECKNSGNMQLLQVFNDIVIHSQEIDFQEGKNLIFEGISNSEVMPTPSISQENSVYNTSMQSPEKYMCSPKEFEVVNVSYDMKNSAGKGKRQSDAQPYNISDKQEGGIHSKTDMPTTDDQVDGNSFNEQDPHATGGYPIKNNYTTFRSNLIKNFNNDENQIIEEESKEESMSVLTLNQTHNSHSQQNISRMGKSSRVQHGRQKSQSDIDFDKVYEINDDISGDQYSQFQNFEDDKTNRTNTSFREISETGATPEQTKSMKVIGSQRNQREKQVREMQKLIMIDVGEDELPSNSETQMKDNSQIVHHEDSLILNCNEALQNEDGSSGSHVSTKSGRQIKQNRGYVQIYK